MSDKFQIKHRFTAAVLFECDLPAGIAEESPRRQLGYAIKEALKAGANLAGAYLAGANLAGANLADANLAGANLAGAYLAGANLAGANLAGAYLAGANLADANLAGANLAGAYLAGANLAGAYLADAYLAGAYLAGAYLAGAYLAGAYLAGAYLADAYLAGAYLADAYLADAYLADAYLAGAYLADAYLADARNVPDVSAQSTEPPPSQEQRAAERAMPRWEREQRRAERYRARNPDVPVVEAIDSAILQAVEHGGKLEMSQWHKCSTTHCRAGWAITLAGEAGAALEARHGPAVAGRMIYVASAGYCPHFYAETSRALEDIRERAAEQAALS